ncbi:MAG TPA: nucleotide disphospho-sugar-binding domain-containing protein [Actinomycetota bacterium]|nr:nucleotide disphospho-sugar-binding domain-containing protein [Actinomycetota bacterium]
MLAVARALAARGHQVTFSSGAQHIEDAAREGLRFVEMPVIVGSTHERLRPYEDSEDMARAFTPIIDAEQPDVVVADLLTLGPALAAEARRIPLATLLIHPLHSPSKDLPPFGWGRAPARGLLRRRDSWLRASNVKTLQRARDDLNRVRANLGLAPTTRLDAQISDQLALVATLPSLELPRSDWPPYAHVIGPCLYDAGGATPDLPPGDGPLVLIAASTAHEQRPLIDASVDAVARLGTRALLTVGKSDAPSSLPSSIVATGFVSHDAVLSACDAVVCNGGHGIVARALTHAVPVVVVPGHGDQQENGYRVARSGAGVVVKRRKLATLRRALQEVLSSPRYKAAADRIAREAAALDGPARAAELVEALVSRAGSGGRATPSVDVSEGTNL